MDYIFKNTTPFIVGLFCGIAVWSIQRFENNECKRAEQTIKNMHYYANITKEGKE